MKTSRPRGARLTPASSRPRRYPSAYSGPANVRPSGPDIRLHVGPLPIRVARAVWLVVRRIFGVPAVPEPIRVAPLGQPSGPRCLHCKVPMSEKERYLPEPHGVWAVFACRCVSCPVCKGTCRNESRMFLPTHWQSGRPGEITYL